MGTRIMESSVLLLNDESTFLVVMMSTLMMVMVSTLMMMMMSTLMMVSTLMMLMMSTLMMVMMLTLMMVMMSTLIRPPIFPGSESVPRGGQDFSPSLHVHKKNYDVDDLCAIDHHPDHHVI